MGRRVRVKFTEVQVKMLIKGNQLTINIPADADVLELTMDRTRLDLKEAADGFANVGGKKPSESFRDIFNEVVYGRNKKDPFDDFKF